MSTLVSTTPCTPTSLNRREILTLQHVLRGDQRKCNTSSLERLHRRGWLSPQTDGYRLTPAGWQVAERCESLPPDRDATLP